jgi:sialidase-1
VNAREPAPNSNQVRVGAFVLYSDDGGRSWQRGQRLGVPTNENQVVELDDGRLLIDARQHEGRHRWMAESNDGGQSWSEPRPGQNVTPVCTSILRYVRPERAGQSGSWLLWSGPQGPARRDLVIRVSRDQGRSFPAERLIGPGRAAYSNMAMLDNGLVGILWERGQAEGIPGGTVPETIRFTRITPQTVEALAERATD